MLNVQILYLDKATSQGAELTTPASAAPAPMVTKRAGSAQQTSVPVDVNKLKTVKYLDCFKPLFMSSFGMFYTFHVVTRINNQFHQLIMLHALAVL